MHLKDFYSYSHSTNSSFLIESLFLQTYNQLQQKYRLTTLRSKKLFNFNQKLSIYDLFNLLFTGEVFKTSDTAEVFFLILIYERFQYWFFKIKLSIRSYIRNKTGDICRFKHNLEKTCKHKLEKAYKCDLEKA